jgi:hypothetical protein
MSAKIRVLMALATVGLAILSTISCDLLGTGFATELMGTWEQKGYYYQYYKFDLTTMYYYSQMYGTGYTDTLTSFDKANRRFKTKSTSGKTWAWYYKVEGNTLSLYSCNGSEYSAAPTTWQTWTKK